MTAIINAARRSFDAVRGLPWHFWLAGLTSVVFLVLAIQSARSGHIDWAGFQITLSVLAIALATLLATLPSPGRIWVDRQDELGIDDIIFYVYDEPDLGQISRDILFQVYLAVANVGGRKVVLSALRFDRILDASGAEIHIPEFSLPVDAQRVVQGGGWRIEDNVMHHHSYLEHIPGPYLLEPDDVISMRLRARPHIDWSAKWTLPKLKELAEALSKPIASVGVTAVYRRGDRLVRQPFTIKDVTVLQQGLYVERLKVLTNNFMTRPNPTERVITDCRDCSRCYCITSFRSSSLPPALPASRASWSGERRTAALRRLPVIVAAGDVHLYHLCPGAVDPTSGAPPTPRSTRAL